MKLHLELFVTDLERSRGFYSRILRFDIRKQKPDGYTELVRGEAVIALNAREVLPPDHPIYAPPGEPVGRGVEIFLTVDDVAAFYSAVEASGWPISTELTCQPWGRTDFRIVDPDGYYINISSEPTGS